MRRRATAQHTAFIRLDQVERMIPESGPRRRSATRQLIRRYVCACIDLRWHSYIGAAFGVCTRVSVVVEFGVKSLSISLTLIIPSIYLHPFLVRLYFIGQSPCVPWRMRPLFLFEIPTPQRQRQLGCACACFPRQYQHTYTS